MSLTKGKEDLEKMANIVRLNSWENDIMIKERYGFYKGRGRGRKYTRRI